MIRYVESNQRHEPIHGSKLPPDSGGKPPHSTALRALDEVVLLRNSLHVIEPPDDESSLRGTRDWPHAPPHRLASAGVYFVTARTLHQQMHFNTHARLSLVRDKLLHLSVHYRWKLEAWSILANHYHFVGHSPDATSAESLGKFLRHFHGDITRAVNRDDGTPGRTIWHNYRETYLDLQRGYLARLNYTHNNPVHHKLVKRASDYEWCSAGAFERTCTFAWVNTIYSFEFDQIATADQD
jgi:putative transposase